MWKILLITGAVYFMYLLFGGCIFMLLERLYILQLETVFYTNITFKFTDMESILMENFSTQEIDDVVNGWKRELRENYFSNKTVEPENLQWTYSNAFFFAFHLCSTIGYGNIAPSTVAGQMTAILYATIGIPLHIIFFKTLGESFARSYQEIMVRVKGDKESPELNRLGNLAFFLPWTIVFFVLPPIVFMFTEEWYFIEGLYYSFITLSTIGLGDYVAGSKVSSQFTYTLYKMIILAWLIYGLAFTAMIVDYLTHLYQMYFLFSFKCTWKKCACKFERIYVDIEKLDVHFKLLRAEAIKDKYSMWTVREGTRLAIGFRTNHMVSVAALCERIQGELIDLLSTYEAEGTEALPETVPKDAFPVKKPPKDAFPVRQDPQDS